METVQRIFNHTINTNAQGVQDINDGVNGSKSAPSLAESTLEFRLKEIKSRIKVKERSLDRLIYLQYYLWSDIESINAQINELDQKKKIILKSPTSRSDDEKRSIELQIKPLRETVQIIDRILVNDGVDIALKQSGVRGITKRFIESFYGNKISKVKSELDKLIGEYADLIKEINFQQGNNPSPKSQESSEEKAVSNLDVDMVESPNNQSIAVTRREIETWIKEVNEKMEKNAATTPEREETSKNDSPENTRKTDGSNLSTSNPSPPKGKTVFRGGLPAFFNIKKVIRGISRKTTYHYGNGLSTSKPISSPAQNSNGIPKQLGPNR